MCPDTTWTQFGIACYIVVLNKLDWPSAKADCISRGGDLVSIHSQEEDAFVFGKFSLDSSYISDSLRPYSDWSARFLWAKQFGTHVLFWVQFCMHFTVLKIYYLALWASVSQTTGRMYLGLTDEILEGVYRWSDGTAYDYNNLINPSELGGTASQVLQNSFSRTVGNISDILCLQLFKKCKKFKIAKNFSNNGLRYSRFFEGNKNSKTALPGPKTRQNLKSTTVYFLL